MSGEASRRDDGRWEGRLGESGALTRGHFRLSSGLHSPAYVQCARYLEDPRRARQAGEALAERLGEYRVDSVLAPALGALLIGHEVAAALGVPFRFTERAGGPTGGEMTLRRGFALRPGERLALIEDAITTGKSTLETAEVARRAGAEVVAVGSIVDRTGDGRPFGDLPFVSLVRLDLPAYPPDDCPLCAAGTPAVKPGSRPDAEPGGWS